MDKQGARSQRRCRIFNCDRRHGNFCCYDCGYKKTCKNPCQNAPDRCRSTTSAQKKDQG